MTNARTARTERERKAAELRAATARRQARRRSLVVTSAVAGVLAAVVAAFVLVHAASGRDAASGATPAHVTAAGGIVVGQASAPVTLVAYEDFLCPVCAEFESGNAAQLKGWIADGTV